MAITIPADLRILFHFMVHIVCAALLFSVVAGVALLLWAGTIWIKGLGAPYEIWVVCYWVSELLFWFDVGCFGFYVICQGTKLIGEIWDGRRRAA